MTISAPVATSTNRSLLGHLGYAVSFIGPASLASYLVFAMIAENGVSDVTTQTIVAGYVAVVLTIISAYKHTVTYMAAGVAYQLGLVGAILTGQYAFGDGAGVYFGQLYFGLTAMLALVTFVTWLDARKRR